MRYRILCVDKVREKYVAAAVEDFTQRLRRYEDVEIVEISAARGNDAQRALQAEGNELLRSIAPNEHVWLLERTGSELSSVELADRLQALALHGTSRLTLVIAGAYGASAALIERAEFAWSLSRLTFLHEWARALTLEQLYRATKIARHEPYHN